MSEQALIVKDKQEIEVRNFERRIAEFLPGARDVPQQVRLAMAQIAIVHGLDPFLKEVWPIPQKDRDKNIVGWDLMIGIAGWRASAHRSNEYWGRRFEKCTAEEREWLGAQGKDIAFKCIVMRRKTGHQPMEFDGYGVFHVGREFSKMNPLQCARNRAERDAMKAAFPISMPIGVEARIADEETGEVINGTHSVEWTEPIASQQDEGTQETDAPDQLSTENGRDVVTNEAQPEQPTAPKLPRPAAKKCSIKTPLFASRLLPALAEKTKYYNDGKDAPQPYHILGSAAQCGYSEITADNVEAVLIDLVQYAIEKQLDIPQAQA